MAVRRKKKGNDLGAKGPKGPSTGAEAVTARDDDEEAEQETKAQGGTTAVRESPVAVATAPEREPVAPVAVAPQPVAAKQPPAPVAVPAPPAVQISGHGVVAKVTPPVAKPSSKAGAVPAVVVPPTSRFATRGEVARIADEEFKKSFIPTPDGRQVQVIEPLNPENFSGTVRTLAEALDAVKSWCQQESLWPVMMGLSCCAIEMMGTAATRYDLARFGAEVFRPSPRQADIMIVAGTVTKKMAPVVRRIYDQMADPKWVIAMGACSSCGGMYNVYSVLQGVDEVVPVDVYVPGCPPRPEALIYGVMQLQKKIREKARQRSPHGGALLDFVAKVTPNAIFPDWSPKAQSLERPDAYEQRNSRSCSK